MQVNRQELLTVLQAVSPGLATRETVEQSACFCFLKGRIITYNTEIACMQKSPVAATVATGAVVAKPLLEILDKLAEEDVDITCTGSHFIVKGRGRTAKIRMEATSTLPIEQVDIPPKEAWVPLDPAFGEAVGIAVQCTTKDDKNGFYLTCVHIHPEYIEACDNFQIVRYPLATGIRKSVLIKRETIKHIPAMGMTMCAETKSWLHFRNPAGLMMSCRKWYEDYPNFGDIVAIKGTPITMPGGLGEAIDKAKIFSADNAAKDDVKVDLRTDRMRLTGAGVNGEYYETKSVKYAGPDLSFLIAPDILADITKRHTECEVTAERLKVNGGRYTYVSCLSPPTEEVPIPEPAKEE